MLSEAHGRQITCSNDTAYVGSRPPFSARAGKSVYERLTAPMSARACFTVLPRSLTASESPPRSQHPRTLANNNRMGLRGFCRFANGADKLFGLIMQRTVAWHVIMISSALWGTKVRMERGGVLWKPSLLVGKQELARSRSAAR